MRCGVKEVRYPFRNENCVLCGRCVRMCTERAKAKAIGFVGRGKDRHVDFPFGSGRTTASAAGCIQLCPMTITPCGGPMKPGEERLCGQCDSQLNADAQKMPGVCVWCELGKGFQCSRYLAI